MARLANDVVYGDRVVVISGPRGGTDLDLVEMEGMHILAVNDHISFVARATGVPFWEVAHYADVGRRRRQERLREATGEAESNSGERPVAAITDPQSVRERSQPPDGATGSWLTYHGASSGSACTSAVLSGETLLGLFF